MPPALNVSPHGMNSFLPVPRTENFDEPAVAFRRLFTGESAGGCGVALHPGQPVLQLMAQCIPAGVKPAVPCGSHDRVVKGHIKQGNFKVVSGRGSARDIGFQGLCQCGTEKPAGKPRSGRLKGQAQGENLLEILLRKLAHPRRTAPVKDQQSLALQLKHGLPDRCPAYSELLRHRGFRKVIPRRIRSSDDCFAHIPKHIISNAVPRNRLQRNHRSFSGNRSCVRHAGSIQSRRSTVKAEPPLMTTNLHNTSADGVTINMKSLRRKVAWRVLPLVFLLYIVAYLDRANVGFAKLRMAADLGFSEAVYGLGIGIFFIGYLILEIPGALLVERWSARKWFARILVTWGLISSLTAFVTTPMQFYIARFFLGVAEAGFFPGIIVYFTHWFTAQDRTRALSGLVMAVPFSLAMGAPVSAMLLDVHWLGLEGWQWMFILEGIPGVLLGFITLRFMTDRPRHAKWLTPEERDYLEAALAAEAEAKEGAHKISVWQALRLRNVWLLTLGIFATNTGGYVIAFWIPTMVKSLSGGTDLATLLYSGLFYACGIAGVYVSGQSADRTGDRKWHCVAGQTATALFLAGSAITGQPFFIIMTWLCLTGFAAFFWPSPFWSLPTLTLTSASAAVAIGFINMSANLAGWLGNYYMGWLKSQGGSDSGLLLLLADCYLLGALLVCFVKIQRTSPPSSK